MPDSTYRQTRRPMPPAPNTDVSLTEQSQSDAIGDLANIDRLAKLVADGQIPVPSRLDCLAKSELLREVGRIRHSRLFNYVARAIAQDIHRSRDSAGDNHVQKTDF